MSPKNKKRVAVLTTVVVVALSFLFQDKDAPIPLKALTETKAVLQEPLVYSKHARCRMECRFISEAEVQDVLQNGQINAQKSDAAAKPCPVQAVEKRTADAQRVRVVYGMCASQKKIITVIDLENDHKCSCS